MGHYCLELVPSNQALRGGFSTSDCWKESAKRRGRAGSRSRLGKNAQHKVWVKTSSSLTPHRALENEWH